MYRGDMGSDRHDMAEKLGDLMHLDMDAVEAYNEAIERIEEQDIRSQLSSFRDDHQRHVTEIQRCIADLGEKVPEARRDAKGVLIEGMTAMRSAMGTDQAMKAMRQNEHVTTRGYKDAIDDENWTTDIMSVLQRGYSDEQRHLAWIEDYLSVGAGVGGRTHTRSGSGYSGTEPGGMKL